MPTADLQKLISSKFTADVLLEILRKKSGCKQVCIRSIDFGPEAKKGESYLSTVTKFSVKAVGKRDGSDDEEFEVHIIVKSFPDNIARRKTFRSVDFFSNEIAFYNKVWPALKKFQESKNVSNAFNSIPTCLAAYSDGVNDYIALEDVTFKGYRSLSRGTGLDFEQAKAIIRTFAHFHGLSLAFKDQHPEEFKEISDSMQETYFAEKFRKWYEGSMKKFCTVVRDAVEKELPVSYLKKLDVFLNQDLYGEILKLCALKDSLAVITHGDCWAPNFLVKYDGDGDNGLNGIILIDYQLARCSSLVTDLLFFLNTCLDQQTLAESWDTVMEYYHQTLVKFLEELGSNPNLVTLNAIRDDVKKYGIYGFGICMEAIVMSLIEDEDIADINMIEGEDAVPLDNVWIIRPIENQEKRRRVACFFKNLVDKNII